VSCLGSAEQSSFIGTRTMASRPLRTKPTFAMLTSVQFLPWSVASNLLGVECHAKRLQLGSKPQPPSPLLWQTRKTIGSAFGPPE